MAINSIYHGDENHVQPSYTMTAPENDPSPSSLTAKSLISSISASSNYRRRKTKNKNKTFYLSNDSVHLHSFTEEKCDKNVLSSFQLAAKLYKSNSDEFKLKKKLGKKNKKSVLTLPNEPSMLPQSCTVSDMNDTEYLSRIQKPKPQKAKKRVPFQKKRLSSPSYNYEYYDRDADYCSQMNVYLDCSSVDVKNFKGDHRKTGGYDSKNKNEDDVAPSDVWAVLRNINRFQFHPSPPLSDDSAYEVVMPRKKKAVKKKLNRGVYETCRTEQISYFSNIEVNVPRAESPSGSSQITVIDNKICVEVEKTFDEHVPYRNQMTNFVKPVKTKPVINNRSRKTNLAISKKKSDSKETLVGPNSKTMIKPTEITNKHNDSFVEAPKENICTAVEVQTEKELEEKDEANKARLNTQIRTHNAAAVTHTGFTSGANLNQNINGRLDMKAPLRRPFPTQIPWRNVSLNRNRGTTSPQNAPPARLLPTALPKTAANTAALTISKIHDISPTGPAQITSETIQPLTLPAIRRIMAKIKFPLVILGKDQLSGTFEVEEYDYPQFKGLDEQCWPFMVDWMDKPNRQIELKTAAPKIQAHNNSNFKEKTTTLADAKYSKREQMRKTNVESRPTGVDKVKPAVSRFRDNMLKLLYKKSSHQNIAKVAPTACIQRDMKVVGPLQVKSTNTNTKNYKNIATSSTSLARTPVETPVKTVKQRVQTPPLPTSPSKILIPPRYRESKPLWGKAKWASDFIDNIIQKIKNGTYYTSETHKSEKIPIQNRTSDTDDLKPVNGSKEVSIQVTLPITSEDFTPKITIQKKKELTSIMLPGFDDVVPQLEIKSLTRNQIAVKHCVTNVVLQFDVNVPPEAERNMVPFKRSTSCVPLTVTESKSRVFKCKARILNAVLPAELCSIIPKVMMQFLDKEAPLALTLQEDKRNSSLSTIYTIPEVPLPLKLPLLSQLEMFPELRRLRNGRFSKSPKLWTEKTNSNENIYIISVNELPYKFNSIEVLLQRPQNIQDYFIARPAHTLFVESTKSESTLKPIAPIQELTTKTNLCTDLVPYTGNEVIFNECNTQITPLLAFQEFFKTMLKGNTYSISEYFPSIVMHTCNNHVYVNISFENHQGIGTSQHINATSIHLEQLEPLKNNNNLNSQKAIGNKASSGKHIEYIKHAKTKERNHADSIKPLAIAETIKSRKKSHLRYVKLYKKCKSTSHIVAERSSTPLSKMTNLDEFFQALGSGKLLSSAVDGSCGSKILSFISDLKSYITGITPRQALLVMLLANKKDTSNLVRFRPMILQGIAVNRITRVSELDMEVEVIEKEKFKMSEYLDTPPSFQTTHNNDNLLEELCWIAKTTASDYQKRFDESSEKLLKALLEKRKKLNPSYLRVMARYVGLGLLKTPGHH